MAFDYINQTQSLNRDNAELSGAEICMPGNAFLTKEEDSSHPPTHTSLWGQINNQKISFKLNLSACQRYIAFVFCKGLLGVSL
jgi:hypothetical protein